MEKISKRQSEYLMLIVKDYIATGEPVGSKRLINKYNLQTSSATVRNEMSELEKEGFLEKTHTSSGRIPSTKAFLNYVELTKNKDVDKDLRQKLKQIFSKRTVAIDDVIGEALESISEITNLTLISSSDQNDQLLKSIQLVPIDKLRATIIIVVSNGEVKSKLLTISKNVDLNDLKIAVRIFQERLVDTKLKDLALKAQSLLPILKDKIKNYEFILQDLIIQVFDFHHLQNSHVYGRSNIINNKDVNSNKKLLELLEIMESKSI
jgi:heat-inducible transcriptional repressor